MRIVRRDLRFPVRSEKISKKSVLFFFFLRQTTKLPNVSLQLKSQTEIMTQIFRQNEVLTRLAILKTLEMYKREFLILTQAMCQLVHANYFTIRFPLIAYLVHGVSKMNYGYLAGRIKPAG